MANVPTQTFFTRIQNKHDTATNWASSTLVPLKGEIIVYDPANSTDAPRFKIGDGTRTVPNLPFADDNALTQIGTSIAQLKLGANSQKTTLSWGNTQLSEVTVPYAIDAGTASKLGTANKGSATKGIYLNAGVPTEMSYELKKTVPSNAVFTDTVDATIIAGDSDDTTNATAQITSPYIRVIDKNSAGTVAKNTGVQIVGAGRTAVSAKSGVITVTTSNKKLSIGGKEYDGSTDVSVTVSDLGLSNAMHFLGVSTTAITDGGTQTPTIGGSTKTPVAGDVVLYGDKEFVYGSDNKWIELGDEGSYALKTITITAGSGLSGGGDLTANRTIKHATPTGAAADSKGGSGKYIANITTDEFGHITAFGEGTLPTLSKGTTTGSGNAVTDISVSGHTITLTKGTTFAVQADLASLKGAAVDGISTGTANGTISYTVNGTSKGDVKVKGLESAAYKSESYFATKSHDSDTATTYGAGTASKFGHVKVVDSHTGTNASLAAANSVALSPKGLANYAAGVKISTIGANDAATWVLFNCGTSTSVL